MNNGCPTVKWISLLLTATLLCGSLSFNHFTKAQTVAPASKKVAHDLARLAADHSANTRVRVVIQFSSDPDPAYDSILAANEPRERRSFPNLNTQTLEIPVRAVEALVNRPEVSFISLDQEVGSFGHVSLTTGADAARRTNGTNVSGLDGTGIGIAVLDSGIDLNHTSFLDRGKNQRVIFNRDFTGEGRTDDPYGHGTHVASIAAGNGRISNAQYTGIAPNANLINLR